MVFYNIYLSKTYDEIDVQRFMTYRNRIEPQRY